MRTNQYTSFTSEQAKVSTNAAQVFEAFDDARNQARRFEGSMSWKRISGREYLYRVRSGGRSSSLGPRSKSTEAQEEAFVRGKIAHKERLKNLKAELDIHAGYARLNRLNRFPTVAARVVRALHQRGVPHRVVGTNALYAYELAAGVLLLPEHLATEDIDVLLDARRAVKIATRLRSEQLLSLLRKADRSFSPFKDAPRTFCAVNDRGYRVDFITQGASQPMRPGEFERLLDEGDLQPARIDSLKWVLSTPRFSAVVFDQRGMPLRVDTLDPRAFALHKHFVSKRDDRSPAKRGRDAVQADIVAELLLRELRHLPGGAAIAQAFPAQVASDPPLGDDLEV